jgi:hypothetical protein
MTPEATPRPPARPDPTELDDGFRPEDHGLPPPLTKAQGMARRREDFALHENYPDRYVAYIDTWTGDELHRVVLFAAKECAEFHKLLDALDPEARRRVETTHVRDPEDGFFCPSFSLDDPSAHDL